MAHPPWRVSRSPVETETREGRSLSDAVAPCLLSSKTVSTIRDLSDLAGSFFDRLCALQNKVALNSEAWDLLLSINLDGATLNHPVMALQADVDCKVMKGEAEAAPPRRAATPPPEAYTWHQHSRRHAHRQFADRQ